MSVGNLNIHNRQSNKQVFFSLEFVNILLQVEAKAVKKNASCDINFDCSFYVATLLSVH